MSIADACESIKPVDILLIDDSDLLRRTIVRTLETHGYTIADLPSPMGATRAIIRQHVRLIILDINMPHLQGDKFAAQLRKNPRMITLKIVLFSGIDPSELERIGMRVHADAVANKMDGTVVLVKTIKELLGEPCRA